MIKYICDLCGKESGYLDKYYIPMMHSDGKFKSVQLHLCDDCCNRIDLFIHDIASKNMEKRLNQMITIDDDEWLQYIHIKMEK